MSQDERPNSESCPVCGKPRQVPTRAFREWFKQRPTQGVRFITLREFLADYCTCEIPPGELL
jgi:hypothetical protein